MCGHQRKLPAIVGRRTFVYHFNRVPPYYPDQHDLELHPPSLFGSHHGSEQVYLYNNLDALPRPDTSARLRLLRRT
jgi:hypothetical protein